MKRIFTFCLSILSMAVSAQERINKQLPVISKNVNSQLLTAKGWRQQPDGQWMSRNNRIPRSVDATTKILVDYEDWGLGTDNFVSYQFRHIEFEGNQYTILIKKSKWGQYRYPAIEKGWYSTFKYSYIIFDKSNLKEKLDSSNFVTDTVNEIEVKPVKIGFIESDNATTILKDIASEISAGGLDNKNYIFVFRITPYKKKGVVQFFLYDKYDTQSDIGILGITIPPLEKKELTVIYYETPYTEFSKFIKLP